MTAALGLACGLGELGLAIIGAILTVIVLGLAGVEEAWAKRYKDKN